MTTTHPAVEHIDALRDVFTEVTQDCLLLGLTPVRVDVGRYSKSVVHVGVQFMGTDTAAVDQVAGSWDLPADNGTTGNYTRTGRLDIDGRRVTVTVFTGRPKRPAFPAGYQPQAVQA